MSYTLKQILRIAMSFKEQPISDKTLGRFRRRCYTYETLHGVGLYYDCDRRFKTREVGRDSYD